MAFDLVTLLAHELPAWAFVVTSMTYAGRDIAFTWLKSRMQIAKAEGRAAEVIADVHDVYEALNIFASETDAMGVWVLRAENGGNIPTVGKDLTSSIVYEVCGPDFCASKPSWTRQILDKQHVSLLKRLHVLGPQAVLPTDDSGDFGALLFSQTGVGCAYAAEVYSTEGAYYYMVTIYPELPEVESMAYRNKARACVSAMSARFDKWHKTT